MTLFKRWRPGELDEGAVEFVPRTDRSWTASGMLPVPWAACVVGINLPDDMHMVMVNIQWGAEIGPGFTVQGTDLVDAAGRGARLAVDLLTAYARNTVVPERPVVLHLHQPCISQGATCAVKLILDIEKVEA